MIDKNRIVIYFAEISLHFYPYQDRHGARSGLILYFIYSCSISYFNSYCRRFDMPLSHYSSGKNKYQHKSFIVVTIDGIRNQGIIRVSSLQSHALSTKKKTARSLRLGLANPHRHDIHRMHITLHVVALSRCRIVVAYNRRDFIFKRWRGWSCQPARGPSR